MNWIQKGNRHLSSPYMLVWVRMSHGRPPGWECWIRIKDRYCILYRGVSSLDRAQELCTLDKARRDQVSA